MNYNKLNSDVENYLNNILIDIKNPIFNISPNFSYNSFNKNHKNKNMRNYKKFQENFIKISL